MSAKSLWNASLPAAYSTGPILIVWRTNRGHRSVANVNRPRGGKIDNHLDQNSAPRVKKQEFARSQARTNKGKAFSWEHNMFSLSKDRIDAFSFPLEIRRFDLEHSTHQLWGSTCPNLAITEPADLKLLSLSPEIGQKVLQNGDQRIWCYVLITLLPLCQKKHSMSI